MTDSDQPQALWELFNEAMHEGQTDIAKQIQIYADETGLDITAAQMENDLKTKDLNSEPHQD